MSAPEYFSFGNWRGSSINLLTDTSIGVFEDTVESAEENGGDSTSGRLLRDIEEISRALYLHNASSSNSISPSDRRSKSAGRTRPLESNRKSSIWNWEPLKALTRIRHHRFNCWFFLHVHAIEGLPSNFNGMSLRVQWKRKEEVLLTRPVQVCQGMAEFEQTLMHQCSVYGSRAGHSAKYEPKLFVLRASVVGAPQFDLGKHWVDVTRLLPLTLEELREKSSSRWTTSFKLTGMAKGAMLNVSFWFSVIRDNTLESDRSMIVPKLLKEDKQKPVDCAVNAGQNSSSVKLQKVGSVPGNSNRGSHLPSLSLDIKDLDENLFNRGSELARSISFLYQKLDEAKLGSSQEFDFFYEQLHLLKQKPGYFPESSNDNIEDDPTNDEFTVIEQGIEVSQQEQLKLEGVSQVSDDCAIETIDVAEIFKDHETGYDGMKECDSIHEDYGYSDQLVMEDRKHVRNDICSEELTAKELDLVTYNLSISEADVFDSSLDVNEFIMQENYEKNTISSKACKMVKSYSLDDITESIANDFLKMLATEHNSLGLSADTEPDSPRNLLLRQFEEEAFASGDFIINFNAEEEHVEFESVAPRLEGEDFSDHSDLPLFIQPGEKFQDHSRMDQPLRSKRNAKLLENLETDALMKEWGLNEKVFQDSPCTSTGGFGSPIYLPPNEPLEYPPLGEGLGPVIKTKNGGFLRSMNPSLFQNAKNSGRLIMQVSTPVVLPMAMGSSIMEILQHWASVGYEKMSTQVNKLMPLEDIKGKTIQHVTWEAASRLETPKRPSHLQQESQDGKNSVVIGKKPKVSSLNCDLEEIVLSSIYDEIDSDYVSLKDLAPLAMDKIEALSIEGLRIQSGMSDEEAPSSISPQSFGETSAFLGKSVRVGGPLLLEGASGLCLPEVQDKDGDIDELVSLSVTLDEWMKLDAGYFGDADEIDERTLKILAAHMAENIDYTSAMLAGGCKWDKPISGGSGFLGNNLTVILRMQLRDPLRDYENVGVSMLALLQVERVFFDLQPKVHCGVPDTSDIKEAGEVSDQAEGIKTDEKLEKTVTEGIPWFKINEVHVVGFKTEPGKKRCLGTSRDEQSGARWLLASNMCKNRKHLYSMSKAMVKSSSPGMTKMQPKDCVWSISSHVHGPKAKWKELATLNLHIRNPDVIFLT
ncbi:hypothetical protein NMG60_11001732 [Bertholletia excelsa]